MAENKLYLYKILGYLWEFKLYGTRTRDVIIRAEGPFCPPCRYELDILGKCEKCGKEYKLKESVEKLKNKAIKHFKASSRESYEIISLDIPPSKLKNKTEDDNYFLVAQMGQKDGKRVGLVYFGEKTKSQKDKDYSQIFVDLDDEQLRFDKSNKHPKKILCKFRAEFPDVVVEQKFKDKEK